MNRKLMALAMAALLPAACEDDKKTGGGMMAAREKIKIGAMHTLTGEYADYGIPAQNAVKLAVKEINAAGGVLGKDLEVEFADSATDVNAVGASLTALLGKGIVALVEDNSSGISLKMLEQTGPMNIPQISASSTSPELSKPSDNFFRTAPSDALQAIVLAKKAREEGLSRVAIIHQADDSYGVGLNEKFGEAFVRGGGTVTSVTYGEMQASYADQMRQALAAGPDGILLVGTTGAAVEILQEARAQGARVRWLFPDALKVQTFIDNLNVAKPLVEGAIGTAPTTPQDPADIARSMRFKTAYMAEFSAEPVVYNDAGYDSVYLLAAAMQRAGSTDGTAVMGFIREVSRGAGMTSTTFGPGEWAMALTALQAGGTLNYQGAAGPVDLDINGDPGGFYVVWTVMNGTIMEGAVETPEL